MFFECEKLEKISGLNFPKLEDGRCMFKCCKSLTSVSDLNFPKLVCGDEMFKNCGNLSSLVNLNFPELHDAHDFFEGCRNLKNISHLNFQSLPDVHGIFNCSKNVCFVEDLNFGKAEGRYHVFCNHDCMNESGIPQFRNSYLNLEKNSYPAWYFRSASCGSKFNLTVFLDEFFKFIFSYRSLGLELFSKFYLNQSTGHGVDIFLEMLNKKNIIVDLDHLSYPQSASIQDVGEAFLHHAYYDVYSEVFHDAENRCRGNVSVFKPFFKSMYDTFNRKEYRYRHNPLDGFKVEFSDEKKYCRYGYCKRSDALKTANTLLHKYSADTEWSDAIIKIQDALEKIEDLAPEAEYPEDSVRNSIKSIDEIINRNHTERKELTGREFNRDSDTADNNPGEDNQDVQYRGGKSIESSEPHVCTIEQMLLDNLPENMPSDISEWIDQVKNIEISRLRLGRFEPGAYPLKIVMYTEAIKETARNNAIDEHYLFEAVLANNFFRALLFVTGIIDRFEDPMKLADICRIIPVFIPIENIVRELWLQLQKDTLNHWYCNAADSVSCGADISSQVIDPLAQAFEISWIKDRIITSGGNCEWKKIMDYELSRFGGIASYPSDPSIGAKYLIAKRTDRRKLADMATISLNISALMQILCRNMKQAHQFFQNTLVW
jgi:hypothetical protein